jgi:YD repeat-containing protein
VTEIGDGWRDTDSDWHSDTEYYGYDGLNRLTSATCSSWSDTYSYDKVGNRTAKNGTTYTINSVNEVTALSDGTTFAYDDNGNLTEKTIGNDTWSYSYDYANRLTGIEKNSAVQGEYCYDGFADYMVKAGIDPKGGYGVVYNSDDDTYTLKLQR